VKKIKAQTGNNSRKRQKMPAICPSGLHLASMQLPFDVPKRAFLLRHVFELACYRILP
jgi:hypothetical protein